MKQTNIRNIFPQTKNAFSAVFDDSEDSLQISGHTDSKILVDQFPASLKPKSTLKISPSFSHKLTLGKDAA